MFRPHWLRNLFALGRTRKDRRCQAAQQPCRVHLMLEPLEDRITPTTYFRYNPSFAVQNAMTAEAAANDYVYQIFTNIIQSAAAQASSSAQNNAALTALLTAISNELSSPNFQSNSASLLALQMQMQQHAAQPTPLATGLPVGSLTN